MKRRFKPKKDGTGRNIFCRFMIVDALYRKENISIGGDSFFFKYLPYILSEFFSRKKLDTLRRNKIYSTQICPFCKSKFNLYEA